jgi:hypothetical protein
MKTHHILGHGMLGLGLLLTLASAQAGTNWQLTSKTGCSSQVTNPTAYGNSCVFNGSDGTAMTATAWSNTANSATASNTILQDAYLGVYSGGLGVANRDGASASSTDRDSGDNPTQVPEHATDNNQRYDSVLFSFAKSIQLTQIGIGYLATDSDMTVLAYTGTSVPPPLAGKSYAELTATQGWTLIGHYDNVGTNAPRTVNAAGVTSSYWLIGAYNPLVGGSTGWTLGNDHVKIASLAGEVPQPPSQVPEPSSLLLLGTALAGIMGLRRKRGS